MKRRTMIGLTAAVTGGLLAGATAFAFGWHGGRHGMMKRFVSAQIDEVLDEARVSPEQRTTIYAARDRVFAAIEDHWRSRGARLEEALALFEADRIDPDQVRALHRQREEEHRKIAEAVSQAILDAHDTLTPEQRRIVTEYVRAHRPHHMN
jgi:Spy/CpxP family protein refolding chaperone